MKKYRVNRDKGLPPNAPIYPFDDVVESDDEDLWGVWVNQGHAVQLDDAPSVEIADAITADEELSADEVSAIFTKKRPK